MKDKCEKPKVFGQRRNDLPGYMFLRGNKIYVKYKGCTVATGFNNSVGGWRQANTWWAGESRRLREVEDGLANPTSTFGEVFAEFMAYKKDVQRLQTSTLQCYADIFRVIFKSINPKLVLNEDNIELVLDEISRNSGNTSATTVNDKLVFLRNFLNWAAEEERNYIAKKDYTKKYKQKPSAVIRSPYSVAEYDALIDYFEKKAGEKDDEMVLLLRFLWETGARIGETLAIKNSDVKLADSYIIIPNKVNKGLSEKLFITDRVKVLLEEIIVLAVEQGRKTLFSWTDKKLPYRKLLRAEKRLGMKEMGRGLHGFRRAFCDRLFETGFDISTVKDIMRHKDIATTIQHYKSINGRKILEEMNERLGK